MSYLTKEEADNKICPHIVYSQTTLPSGQVVSQNQNCLTYSCMAWRWAGNLPSTKKGYCGLAGRPDQG